MLAMRRLGPVVAALLTLLALLVPSPVRADDNSASPRTARQPVFARKVPASTTQVVRTVTSRRWCAQVYCTVTQAWQRQDDGRWLLMRRFRSTIGSHGWGKTREGDLRSPVGVYRIVVTFSTGRRPGPMPWRKRLATSILSPSPGPNYNTWLEIPGRTSGNRPSMRWGWVVDYNHPRLTPGKGPAPVQGKGSGIFYHTSIPGRPWSPTEGCTQVGNPAAMHWLVHWLRPSANPQVVQDL
jgi:L,D-peptidoglycan transpeptidase YkuD (ErfK/YbiS/YcfS/YnhG family)